MSATSDSKPPGKGAFVHGAPTTSGKIPFTPPGTNVKCETAYWLWGSLDAGVPPLIVLHGGPGAPGRDWKPLAALNTSHGIPLLLYDQIGCGESTHLRDRRGDTKFWTMELFLTELQNLRDHLHITTFDLLGHSCGGMIALSCALTQPSGLRKLIIASAPASEALRQEARAKQRTKLPQNLIDALSKGEKEQRFDSPEFQEAGMELMRRHFCRLDTWPAEINETSALMSEDDTVSYTLYGPDPNHPVGAWKDYNTIDQLSQITEKTAPGGVLLTNGHYDMNPDETMAPLFNLIRARVKWVRFAESAHMPHIEEYQAYMTALADFLTMA